MDVAPPSEADGTKTESPGKRQSQAASKRMVVAQVQSEKLVSDRRERIIQAAITTFHNQGFHSTTTADIAAEAGLTQSNIYNYVKSKQDVLFLVCEHLVGMYDAVIDRINKQYEDPYLRLANSLKAILEVMSTYPDELQLLYNETHSLERADRLIILGQVSRFIGRFEALITDYEQASGTTTLKDRRLAANLLSFVPAIVALRSWDLRRYGSEGGEELILNFLLDGMRITPLEQSVPAQAAKPKRVLRTKRRTVRRLSPAAVGGDGS